MSGNPLRFPAPEKEAPFDATPVRKIILELLVKATNEVESEQLEIKGWCRDERELAEKVAEACACIANTSGGFVLVGIADDNKSHGKFSPCPHRCVSTAWLQTSVHNLTQPPVEVIPFDASGVLAEIVAGAGSNLYALRVPRTRYISGHITTKGVAKIRIGKECQPQYIAQDDRTGAAVPGLSLDDLSVSSIDWGIIQHQRHFKTSATWETRLEFLEQERLAKLPIEACSEQVEISLAALLLFGKAAAIKRHVPYFETVILTEREPIRIQKNVIDSAVDLCIGQNSILQTRIPQVPAVVLKEVVVNAFIHRCYRTPGPIVIGISKMDGLEIKNPGALLTGTSIKNLIYGVPVYRNLLLADGARFVGLCDKIGRGIDLIFDGVLSEGLGFPEFDSGDNLFTARIPLTGSPEFKEFLRKRGEILGNLDHVIVLRVLWGKGYASLDDLCMSTQRRSEYAKRLLDEMCKKNMIEAVDQFYRLAPGVRQDIETIFQSAQLPFTGL
jgi:ATP-dependent DNA helicase RecG